MKPPLTCAVALSCLLIAKVGEGQVSVELLDAPPTAYSFEPVYVTYEVRNETSDPVVIPGDPFSPQGVFLQVGLRGEPLKEYRSVSDLKPSRLVWLPPGGRWLFFERVALGPEGEFEIQAVLRSPGECGGRPVGPNKHRIEATRAVEFGARPYDCWSGEVRSPTIRVAVEIPTGEADLAAAEVFDFRRDKENWNALKVHYPTLFKRFPTSHYTYAAFGLVGGGVSMLNVMILQPDNPLNPWAAAAIAAGLAHRNRPCGTPEPWGPGAPADLEERFERVIAAYPPPEPVQAYLRQLETELAAEECQDPAPAGDSASEQEGSENTSSSGRTKGKGC